VRPPGSGGGVQNPLNAVGDILTVVQGVINPLIMSTVAAVAAATAAGDTAGATALIAAAGANIQAAFNAAMAAIVVLVTAKIPRTVLPLVARGNVDPTTWYRRRT